MQSALVKTLSLLAIVGAAQFASAASITDPAGDFLPTFGGSPASGDLDVLNATVQYDVGSQLFRLTATTNGIVGTTANNVYVWGLDQGTGTAGFAANGVTGVRFNRVITFNANGVGNINTLAGSSVTKSGSIISAIVPLASLLAATPAGSFADPLDYTWNLWPRDTTFAGFAAISDFAPDNSNFTTIPGTVAAVPLPAAAWLLLSGLAGTGVFARRRRA